MVERGQVISLEKYRRVKRFPFLKNVPFISGIEIKEVQKTEKRARPVYQKAIARRRA